MLQDRILNNLIKINKLSNQGQQIRYIVPLFFNMIKLVYDNCSMVKIDPSLITKINNKYRFFHAEHQEHIKRLDQVLTYMIDECNDMLETKQLQIRPREQEDWLSKINRNDESNSKAEHIFLPQETYYLDEYFQNHKGSRQSSEKERIDLEKSLQVSLDKIPSFEHSKQEVDDLWDNLEKYYNEHRLDQAYELCQKIKNSQFLYDPNHKLKNEKQKLIETIHQEYKMIKYHYIFFEENGYVFDKEEDGIKMYTSISQKTKEAAIRAEAEIDISIDKFVCLVSEIDLFYKLLPFSYDTKELKYISSNKKIGTNKVEMPLLTNRESYFYNAAYDRLKTHGSVFCFSKTISNDPSFQKKLGFPVKLNPDLVQLVYKFYIIEYVPLNCNRGKIRLATSMDMKMDFLPLFVLKKSLRKFVFDYFGNLAKTSKQFSGSPWQKKMKQRPQLYELLNNRLIEHFRHY